MTADAADVDAATIRSTFRRLTPERHPILAELTRDAIYDDGRYMAPGGLVLADALGRHLALQPGQSVLDVGCGRGQSSIFLAARYDVSVTSVVVPEPFCDTGGWQADYGRYHSAPWWHAHVDASGAFDVEACTEFADGDVMWEDDVLYRGDRAAWSADYLSRAGWLIRHLQYGQAHRPRLTHLLLKAVRRSPHRTALAVRGAQEGSQP